MLHPDCCRSHDTNTARTSSFGPHPSYYFPVPRDLSRGVRENKGAAVATTSSQVSSSREHRGGPTAVWWRWSGRAEPSRAEHNRVRFLFSSSDINRIWNCPPGPTFSEGSRDSPRDFSGSQLVVRAGRSELRWA